MRLWHRLRRRREERKSAVMLAFYIDGKPYVVRAERWRLNHPVEYELQPLGDLLAYSRVVIHHQEPMRLADALIQAGWTPPGDAGGIAAQDAGIVHDPLGKIGNQPW